MKIKRLIEKIQNKIEWKFINPILSCNRRKKLVTDKFTIISNNCWGGRCYEYFNLPKLTPTVGAYFYAEDYLKFCSNLKYYLGIPLVVNKATYSKHFESLKNKGEEDVLVGFLDDVEIVFLYYYDEETIISKWNRRIERINWNNIILKFSYQNECSKKIIEEFLKIKDYSKFVLVGKHITNDKDEIVYARSHGYETVDETENFNKYIKPLEVLNKRLRESE